MKVTIEQAMQMADEDETWRRFQVDYPESQQGNFALRHFHIDRRGDGRKAWIRNEGAMRDPGWGDFTKLVELGADDDGGDLVWMSDTRAEIYEHLPFFRQLAQTEHIKCKRILINGLGLGVVTLGALTFEGVDHVDVVEANPDIAALVGPLMPEDKVTLHLDDAYTIQWPPGARWDLVWHDIWPKISDENLPGMDQLLAKYKRRAAWQDCWQRKGCLQMQRFFKRMEAGTLPTDEALEYLAGKFHFQ